MAGLAFPGPLTAMLRAVSHRDGAGPWFRKPAWSSPLYKRGIPIEVQFWAYRSVLGHVQQEGRFWCEHLWVINQLSKRAVVIQG